MGIYQVETHPKRAKIFYEYKKFRRKGAVVMDCGGCNCWQLNDRRWYYGKGYEPELVDRIGAGDAFDAGFIYGYLSNDIEKGIKYGEALSALKFSIPGDFVIVTKEEVEEFIHRQETVAKPKSYVKR